MTIELIQKERNFLQEKINIMLEKINYIPIANFNLLPEGWKDAAKGRTVWRIVEEVVNQNLSILFNNTNLNFCPAESEIGIFDFSMKSPYSENNIYVNIKSSFINAENNKDDLSKANGLIDFYQKNINSNVYIATFFIDFIENHDDNKLGITINSSKVFPLPWIPDIYVNPSNNGNLQSSKYQNLQNAIKRTNSDFLDLLIEENKLAKLGGRKKVKEKINLFINDKMSISQIANKLNLSEAKIKEIL